MRILQIIPSLSIGGAEVFVARLAAAHQNAGHDVHIAHFRPGPLGERMDPILRARLHPIRKRARYDVAVVPSLLRLIRDLEPEIVHTHLFPSLSWGGAAVRLARGPKWVHTHHSNHLPSQRDARALEAVLLARAHRVVAVSEGTATPLRAHGGRLSKVEVIPNGIPLQGRPRSPIDGDPPVVGTVGRMVPIKAQHTLIQAVALLRDEGHELRLRLVGDGECRPDLEALTDRLKLRDWVQFTGRVNDVADQLAHMDLFVLPSLSEAMPLALLEACAAGLPAVVTDQGGAGAVIEQGGGGWLLRPGDAGRVADRIRSFLALDPPARRALGARSFELAHGRYSMRACAESYERLFLSLL